MSDRPPAHGFDTQGLEHCPFMPVFGPPAIMFERGLGTELFDVEGRRYLDFLIESGNYADYMAKLVAAFNPVAAAGVMCRSTISVSWDGGLYDCDFNQMLDLHVASTSQHIRDFDAQALARRPIVVNQHCYGCTAGAGSSCGGTVA